MTQKEKRSFGFGGLAWAAVGGAVFVTIGLFWTGMITWSSTAEKMAAARADAAVVDVLAPLCVANAQQGDPAKMAEFVAKKSYEQNQFITDAGWITIPNVTLPDRLANKLRDGCRDQLTKVKPA